MGKEGVCDYLQTNAPTTNGMIYILQRISWLFSETKQISCMHFLAKDQYFVGILGLKIDWANTTTWGSPG